MPRGVKANLVGRKFNHWKVLSEAERVSSQARYKCRCKCGAVHIVAARSLIDGSSSQCFACGNVSKSRKAKRVAKARRKAT